MRKTRDLDLNDPAGVRTETSDAEEASLEERREFLKKCGRFAAYTPPAIVALMFYDSANSVAVGY